MRMAEIYDVAEQKKCHCTNGFEERDIAFGCKLLVIPLGPIASSNPI